MNQLKDNAGQCYNNNKGSMLIGLIAAITIIGIMSAGTMYFTSGSIQTGLFSSAHSRAYYLAESGINYAKLNVANNITYTASTQFNLADGDAFIIRTMVDPADASRTIIYSTGIANPGSWFESKYDLTSNFSKSGGGDLTDIVGLTVPDENGNPVLNPIWTVTGGPKIKYGKGKGFGNGNGNLGLQGNKGGTKGKGKNQIQLYYPILLSLGWWKTTPDNPDLAQAWTDNNDLLSYEAQVKIKLEITGGQGDHFMHGISFRLSPQNSDWAKWGTLRSYGISYFKSKNSTWPFSNVLLNGFNGIMNNSVYIVLWEKRDSSQNLFLIDYKKLTTSDGVLDGSDLKDWSTIFLKLEEKLDGPGGTRQNHISGFIQGTSTIPLGTIDWVYGNYKIVQWNNNNPQPVLDNSLITTNFSTIKPNEIGLHAFYDSNASNKQYFADFSLKLAASGASSSFQW